MAKRPRCDRWRQGIGSQGVKMCGQQGWYRMGWWWGYVLWYFVMIGAARRQMPSSTSNGGSGFFVNLGFLIYRIRSLMFFRLWDGPLVLCKDRTVVYWMLLPVYASPFRWILRTGCRTSGEGYGAREGGAEIGLAVFFFSGTLVQQEFGKTPSYSIHPCMFGVFLDAAGFQWPFNSLICSFWSDLDFESYFCVWSSARSEQLVVTGDEPYKQLNICSAKNIRKTWGFSAPD